MSERRTAAGFTLLELVLAMAALALMAAICYAAFHLGIRALQRGEVAVVTAQRLRVASDVLIRQIKSTVAYPARNRDEEVYPYFMGTGTSMAFITAGGLSGGGGLTRVVYRLEEGPRLVMEESTLFSPDELGRSPIDQPGETSTVLLDGFRSLKFEYLMNDGGDTEWRASWDGHEDEMLPSAVRVIVEGMPGLEVPAWGDEIPIMSTSYGENTGEVGDDDVEPRSDEDENADDGTGDNDAD